jgi:hypothetical protein
LPGDALDWWRVEAVEPGRLIRLRAEMKLPGRGWLEFCVESAPGARSLLRQTAYFQPMGVLGLLYWYGLYPIHRIIFAGMIRSLGGRAERLARRAQPGRQAENIKIPEKCRSPIDKPLFLRYDGLNRFSKPI